ncbi:MAG: hypothetical protein JW888_06455 [Pirellulales bacterium]|nr:hypothetical protein [Pirellulales bacterium]
MSQRNRLLVILTSVILLGGALVVTGPFVHAPGRADTLRAGFDAEFISRRDGYPGLCAHYGFTFHEDPCQMAPGLMYNAVANGSVDVIDAFATDGRIEVFDLVILEDDRHFFPPYHAAPLVRGVTLKKYPELSRVLNRLSDVISDEAMRTLNRDVDENGAKPRDTARRFLVERNLLDADNLPDEDHAGVVRIGSKPFTEQEILGEMMALLIESHTWLQVERRLNLGGTMLCFNALSSGDIDLYPEYTGTGLVNILKRRANPDPNESYRIAKRAFAERFDLIWLKPFGFNNTYTLTMRREHARRLGVQTISELAQYLTEQDQLK